MDTISSSPGSIAVSREPPLLLPPLSARPRQRGGAVDARFAGAASGNPRQKSECRMQKCNAGAVGVRGVLWVAERRTQLRIADCGLRIGRRAGVAGASWRVRCGSAALRGERGAGECVRRRGAFTPTRPQ